MLVLRFFQIEVLFQRTSEDAAYAFAKFLLTIIKTVFADAVLTAPGFDCEPALFLLAHHGEPLLVADGRNKLIHDNTSIELIVFTVT